MLILLPYVPLASWTSWWTALWQRLFEESSAFLCSFSSRSVSNILDEHPLVTLAINNSPTKLFVEQPLLYWVLWILECQSCISQTWCRWGCSYMKILNGNISEKKEALHQTMENERVRSLNRKMKACDPVHR